jgi:hypothetical protein
MNPILMVIKPDHAANPESTPEHWRCVDCGTNTAPGFPGRAGVLSSVAGGCLTIHSPDQELYSVHDKLWRKAGNVSGCLCIGCLENRLGRYLRPKDFVLGDPFNIVGIPASARLRDRRGY